MTYILFSICEYPFQKALRNGFKVDRKQYSLVLAPCRNRVIPQGQRSAYMMPALAESDLGRAGLGIPTITTSSDHRGSPRLKLDQLPGTLGE